MTASIRCLFTFALILGCLAEGTADELWMHSGKRVSGTVLGSTPTFWVVLTTRGVETIRRSAVQDLVRPDAGIGSVSDPGPADGGGEEDGGDASAPAKARSVELVVTGTLGSKPLTARHEITHGRLKYFLVNECKPPFVLLESVPPAATGESTEGAVGGESAASAPRAEYRITIQAESGPAGRVSFYSLDLGYRYRCRLRFALERRTGNGYRVLEKLTLVEDEQGGEEARESLAARAYELALESLVEQLSSLEFFGAGKSGDGSTRRSGPEDETRSG